MRTHPSRILIDLDGTLANNIPTLYSAYKHFLSHFQIVGTEKEFQDLIGPPLPKAVEILRERYKIKASLDELIKQYEESIQEGYRCSYEMHAGAETFLEWAFSQNIPLTLATAAPRRLAMDFIKRYDLMRFFERIVTADDTRLTKVESEYFHQLTDHPESTLMIDDSPYVIAAAKQAGLQTHLMRDNWKQLLDEFSIQFNETKLRPHFKVEVVKKVGKQALDAAVREKIELIWEEESKKHNGTLFNGQILSHIGSTPEHLAGEYVEYKHYLAQALCEELRPVLNIQPVGLTVFVTDGTHVLIGERSSEVATHQHLFELVPSGGVDAAYFHNGTIDMEKLVLHELKEESGIDAKSVETLRATHLVHDPATNCYEVCYILTVKSKGEVISTGEHDELLWLPLSEAKNFIKNNPFVPLSEYMLNRILLVR